MYKYQIIGSFLGSAIGDALGMPVEGKNSEYIFKTYGQISKYEKAIDNKFFSECEPGTWTDDTQLLLATAEAMIEAKGFDMDAISEFHKKEYEKTTLGWGSSTKCAVKNIASGTAWSKATEVDYFGSGSGNGVVMKLLPVALYCIKNINDYKKRLNIFWSFTSMTHTSIVAQQATYAHYIAMKDIVQSGKQKFDSATFINEIIKNLIEYTDYAFYAIEKEDNIIDQYKRIYNLPLLINEDNNVSQFRNTIGKGGCYVYESLPLSHAMFLTDPFEFDCVVNAVNYGGDTDTNASMVGGLHGLLMGDEKIPKDLLKGLQDKDRVIDTANKFWELINDK